MNNTVLEKQGLSLGSAHQEGDAIAEFCALSDHTRRHFLTLAAQGDSRRDSQVSRNRAADPSELIVVECNDTSGHFYHLLLQAIRLQRDNAIPKAQDIFTGFGFKL